MSNINLIYKNNRILLFSTIVFMVNILTLKTFISSEGLEVILLSATLVLLLLYYIVSNESLIIYRVEAMWFVFLIYFIFNILYQGRFMKLHMLDIFIFIFAFLLLLFYKINVNYFIIALKTIFVFSLIYALSTLFQFFYTDLYLSHFLHRFTHAQSEEILRLLRNDNYTGFTAQTAYIAGFLVYGIGSVFILYNNTIKKHYRLLLILSLPLLFYSLLLTNKRAHFLFMIIALMITYLFSTEVKRFLNQMMKFIVGIGLLLLTTIITFLNYTPNIDSQIGRFYLRIEKTIEGFIAGEDITSGRIYLYEYALNLFNESPILGIGWRRFQEISIGVINIDRGSHPHNIYFQLLTELGIIGFILFMIPVVYVFIRTIKLLLNSDVIFSQDSKWKVALQYSLYVQSFFLLYGITGNLLTDHIFLLMYFFAVSIVLSSMKYAKVQQESLNQEMKTSLKKNISPHSISST